MANDTGPIADPVEAEGEVAEVEDESAKIAAARPYKIAILAWESLTTIAVGSVAVHVTYLAKSLVERGHEVHMYVRGTRDQEEYENVDGVHYHIVPNKRHGNFLLELDMLGEAMIHAINQTEAFMNHNFEITHCHDWQTAPALRTLKTAMDRKCVFTCHSTNNLRGSTKFGKLSEEVGKLEQDCMGYSDRTIGLSGAICDDVKRCYSFDWNKLRCVPSSFPWEAYEEANLDLGAFRRTHGLDEGDFVFVSVGLFGVDKGSFTLLDAVAKLKSDGRQFKVVFAGSGGTCTEVENMAAELRISDRVKVLKGLRGADRMALFSTCNVVIQPSRSEIFGTTCLEAWAARKAVVATVSSSAKDLIVHQENGLLVDPDVQGLKYALEFFLANPAKAAEMGEAGGEKVRSRAFSWERIAELVNDVYNELYGIYPS